MRCSVIIPTYNSSERLGGLLASLAAQEHDGLLEVLACDDGSSDNTEAVVRAHAHTLPVIYLRQEDRGFRPGAARNMGLREAAGDVIVFLDQDVVVPPDFLDAHLRHYPACGRVVFGYRRRLVCERDGTNKQFPDHRERLFGQEGAGFALIAVPWYYVYSCNMSVSGDLVGERFDEGFTGWGNEDIEYVYRLWRRGASILCEPAATVSHFEDSSPLDPFLSEKRALPADYSTFAINSVRFMDKFPEDESVTRMMREGLRDLSVVAGQCVRSVESDGPDAVIRWARRQIEAELLLVSAWATGPT